MLSTIKIGAITVAVAFLFTSPTFAAPKEHGDKSQGAGHMSDQGTANTNSSNSGDQDKGMDRAKERMSDGGADHMKSHMDEHGMMKGHGKKKAKHDHAADPD